jgi:hypothetical protein
MIRQIRPGRERYCVDLTHGSKVLTDARNIEDIEGTVRYRLLPPGLLKASPLDERL